MFYSCDDHNTARGGWGITRSPKSGVVVQQEARIWRSEVYVFSGAEVAADAVRCPGPGVLVQVNTDHVQQGGDLKQ